jgi:hypothetical protein
MAYAIQAEEEEEPRPTSLPPTLAHPHSREPQNRTYTTAYTDGEGIGPGSVATTPTTPPYSGRTP